MKTFRFNILTLLLICVSDMATAQTKLEKTYKSDAQVLVKIESGHTNVVVEHWDKNEVEIRAFLEGTSSDKKNAEQLLKNWNLETTGNRREVSITSGGGPGKGGIPALPELPPISGLPEIMDPLMGMVGPLLEKMNNNPLPPELFENMGDLNFDYEAYQEDADAYMKEWEKKIEKNFGKDFEIAMEKWAANFEKDTLLWQKDLEKNVEKWGEEFGASMEKWGENFGKSMEEWAEQFEEQMEAETGKGHLMIRSTPGKSDRILRVKIPKAAKLELNIRHGDIRLEGTTTNLNGNFSHSRFSAQTIAGKKTNIKASYTPVKINHWEYGVLNTAYVPSCNIETVKSLKLTSNASELRIGEIRETAIISGTFGKLDIQGLSKGFRTVDLTLKNSDLVLSLPDSPFNINYNGTQSKIQYPSSIIAEPVETYDSEIINGYHKSKNGQGTVSIKAGFSEVTIK